MSGKLAALCPISEKESQDVRTGHPSTPFLALLSQQGWQLEMKWWPWRMTLLTETFSMTSQETWACPYSSVLSFTLAVVSTCQQAASGHLFKYLARVITVSPWGALFATRVRRWKNGLLGRGQEGLVDVNKLLLEFFLAGSARFPTSCRLHEEYDMRTPLSSGSLCVGQWLSTGDESRTRAQIL